MTTSLQTGGIDGWCLDLTVADPYHVLPVLAALTIFLNGQVTRSMACLLTSLDFFTQDLVQMALGTEGFCDSNFFAIRIHFLVFTSSM